MTDFQANSPPRRRRGNQTLFGPDGTQAPPPPRVFPDPLAGLIAADTFVAPVAPVFVPPPVRSVEDMRQAIAAVMVQEQVRPRRRRPKPPPAQPVLAEPAQQKKASGIETFVGCLIILAVVGGLAAGLIAFVAALMG